MFAKVNVVITTTCMMNDVMPAMLMLVEHSGLIFDTQTLSSKHFDYC